MFTCNVQADPTHTLFTHNTLIFSRRLSLVPMQRRNQATEDSDPSYTVKTLIII